MALRQFTEDEQKRAMYFAKLDARRNESTYRTLMERKMQDLRQQNRQAVQEKNKERQRADQAEVKANQAEAKNKLLEDHLRKLGIDPNQI